MGDRYRKKMYTVQRIIERFLSFIVFKPFLFEALMPRERVELNQVIFGVKFKDKNDWNVRIFVKVQ